MSDVKLFRIASDAVQELDSKAVKYEKTLQALLEKHLEAFLRVRFVASEYSTGKTHLGRIDTLGLDENFCPTIIEYKRNSNANVINQGLFYLDWLMDHQADFELLVLKVIGPEAQQQIDWSAPRLLCVAEDFSRYDIHAIQQINRNIELIRYSLFGSDLLLLDLINFVSAVASGGKEPEDAGSRTTQAEHLEKAPPKLVELYKNVQEHLMGLGDDVQERFLKHYIAYKRLRNFTSIQLKTGKNWLLLNLSIDPDSFPPEEGFVRSVRGVGHHGTGDLEVTIKNLDDLERAKPLIQRSFEEN